MRNKQYFIGAMCLVLLSGRAWALNVASNQSDATLDSVRQTVNARLDTEASVRNEQREKVAGHDKAILALKSLQRREAEAIVSKPPAITLQGGMAIGLIGGTPLVMGFLLFTLTRRALRLREEEFEAMRRSYTASASARAEPSTSALRTRVPLDKFLEKRKTPRPEPAQKGELPAVPEIAASLSAPTLQTVTMACDFNALLNSMHMLSSSGLRQTVPGFFDLFIAEKHNFHLLYLDLTGLRLAVNSQSRPGSGEFKVIPPKEAIAPKVLSGEHKLRMSGVTAAPIPKAPPREKLPEPYRPKETSIALAASIPLKSVAKKAPPPFVSAGRIEMDWDREFDI